MNDVTTLLELSASIPEWTPATNRPSATPPITSTAPADLSEKRKAGRPKKNQGDSDSDDSPEVVREGRGAPRLLKILAGRKSEYDLYYDNTGTSYIAFHGKGLEPLTKNISLEESFAGLYYTTTGETLGADGFNNAVKVLSWEAKKTGEKIMLFTRVGESEGRIFYDLKNGRALSIAADGWKIETPSLVHFRHFSTQQPHPDPLPGGSPWLLFNHANVAEEFRLMLMVWVITSFVPRIPYPALLVSGSEGSGKSFFSGLVKRTVDPSVAALQDSPRKDEDFDLLLYKHYCLALDNLSSLPAARADRICSAITGSFIEKRVLHTDTDSIVLPCNPRIILNGINAISNRSDLLDRSITIQLERIDSSCRRRENEMNESFDADIPAILGGIADTLSKAIAIYPTVKLHSYPRMADFCQWGYAVAEALGGRGNEFLRDYGGNSARLSESLIENNTFLSALVQLMDTDGVSYELTFKEIIEKLTPLITPDRTDYSFPTPHTFKKQLERLRPRLEERGILFKFLGHTNKGNVVRISKQVAPPSWSDTAADGVPSGWTVDKPVSARVADDLIFDDEELR